MRVRLITTHRFGKPVGITVNLWLHCAEVERLVSRLSQISGGVRWGERDFMGMYERLH